MTLGTGSFRYRLFDRELHSDLELFLLGPFPPGVESGYPVVSLSLEQQTVAVQGEVILDQPLSPAKIFFDGEDYFFVMERLGYVAVVSKDGLEIRIHPDGSETAGHSGGAHEALADRLVTAVLSRLPVMWGSPSIHGASLEAPSGTVLLLGQSGVGKSTLSQLLVRDHGWTLHDDDTALISKSDDIPTLVPMGGSARLRSDAAQMLGAEGKALAGFAGGKVALKQRYTMSIPRLQFPSLTIEILALDGSQLHGTGIGIGVREVESTKAVPFVWEHVFTTNKGKEQLALRFEVALAVARSPVFQLAYCRGIHPPIEVAETISQLLRR